MSKSKHVRIGDFILDVDGLVLAHIRTKMRTVKHERSFLFDRTEKATEWQLELWYRNNVDGNLHCFSYSGFVFDSLADALEGLKIIENALTKENTRGYHEAS